MWVRRTGVVLIICVHVAIICLTDLPFLFLILRYCSKLSTYTRLLILCTGGMDKSNPLIPDSLYCVLVAWIRATL